MDPSQSHQPSTTQGNTPQHHDALQSPECNLATEQHHHSLDYPETDEQAHIQRHVPLQEADNDEESERCDDLKAVSEASVEKGEGEGVGLMEFQGPEMIVKEGNDIRALSEDDDLKSRAEEIAVAVALLPPLPPSPSSTDSRSSPSSSHFITPASTPSRSPSPFPNTSQGDFVDGRHENDLPEPTSNYVHQNKSHGNDPHLRPSPVSKEAEVQTDFLSIESSFTQTDAPIIKELIDSYTNTMDRESVGIAVQTEEVEMKEVGCNTFLQIPPELLQRAQLAEQLAQIKSEHAAGLVERNQARSERMVAEEMVKIVQSELTDLRQRNIAETTSRVRLENQLGELKAELESARKGLEDKGQRVSELEDTLKGTSLLVRKLEEQSATSLMNRGGIDYMLQAKLADARAQEAEQKLEVSQMELLQSQAEVKRLLDRVGEATRDRSEMVSSKVHNQLLQIADDRAHAAEQKARQLERELLSLREKSGDSGHDVGHQPSSISLSTSSRPFSYTTTLGGYSSLSSTLPPYPSSSLSLHPLPVSTLSTPSLPPTSSPSLEPFKLTFSLPGSEPAALPSSITSSPHPSSPVNTDETTGLLKPSAILGRETVTEKHTSTTTVKSLSSQQSATTVTTHSDTTLELPSFEPTPADHTPPPPPRRATDADKDSSSDWSSSDEGDDVTTSNPLRPSTHSTLKAQWEWRAMGDTESDKLMAPTISSPSPKTSKRPPPVAPKPRTHSTTTSDTYQQEDSSSFLEPARVSGLNPLSSSFRRPQGPQGRNLPTRFSNYGQQF